MLTDKVYVRGRVKAVVTHPGGSFEIIQGNNLIVYDGCELMADLLAENITLAQSPKCIAIGSDGTAPAAGDTDLIAPINEGGGETYKAVAKSVIGVGRTLQCVAAFSNSLGPNPWPVAECVLADTLAIKGSRKIYARSTDLNFNLPVGSNVSIFWEIEFRPNP